MLDDFAMIRRRALEWAVLALPGLVPIVAPYPPFQDWGGHVGVIGALLHPSPFYALHSLWRPNAAIYAAGVALAHVFDPLLAVNVVLAIVLASLGPAMWFLCRSANVDPRLAYLALPLALGRHTYSGFIPNAAALPPALLAWAFVFRLRRAVRPLDVVGLVACLVAMIFAHYFVFLAVACLILAIDVKRPAIAGPAFVCLAGSMVLAPGAGGGVFTAIFGAFVSEDRSGVFIRWWEWLFASAGWMQAVWLVLLGAMIFDARRSLSRPLAIACGILMLGYFVLPTGIGPPLNWWGASLRLPVLAALFAIPLCGSQPRRWLLAPACAVSIASVMWSLAGLREYSRAEMTGFKEVLDSMPSGNRISCLHHPDPRLDEYPGYAHGYICGYYLLEKGGFAPFGVLGAEHLPVSRKYDAPAPDWGLSPLFTWVDHAAVYDGFLVRIDEDNPSAPFGRFGEDLQLVKSSGHWRYYSRARRIQSGPKMVVPLF